jgi:two-component sensor histidine kinase
MVREVTITDGKPKADKTFFTNDSILNCKINSISYNNGDSVWFASEKGLAVYNIATGKMTSYANLAGFDLSSSTSLATDGKGRLWIGNLKGLFVYDHGKMKLLNKNTGLNSNEVFSVFYYPEENKLYAGTSSGISVIDLGLFDSYSPQLCDVVITELRSGSTLFQGTNDIELQPDQSDLYVSFSALNFSSPGSINYRYKLDGDWIETENDFVNLMSLPPGEYKLQLAAKVINGEWGKPAVLNFNVLPGFFESIWFKLLIGLFFLVSGPLILRWQLNVQRKRNIAQLELTERINELKHQALSAMMNPHFVFNSLNSVQYLINSNRNEEANDYIAMMASLMRKNLETAGSGFILLSEEIYRLQLYLKIEKLRLDDKFNWEIIAGNDVDPGIVMIPNMIIQPFVENSIWHGIIESGRKGQLTISFHFEDISIETKTGRALVIRVTDNGIGIYQAKKHKKVDHISKGIEIVEERLRLLSSKLEIPQPILYEDLGSKNIDSQGTEIIISLPASLYRINSGK